ncbi:MAG: cytochrome c [Betaproteobacteria bacterium]|nr:cytochrome c [Betaproteobacteria bacterium]
MRRRIMAFVLLLCLPSLSVCWAQTLGIGDTAPVDLVRTWDIDVRPNGEGLPAGQGSVAQGRLVYERRCLACHGTLGQGGPHDRLAGGMGSLSTASPIKTVGSFWPYATTLFDYIRRAMPFEAPQTLSGDEVYAVVAYVLHLNELLPPDATLDARSLPAVRMPNREGFRSQHSTVHE